MLTSLYQKLSQFNNLLSDISDLVSKLKNALDPLTYADKSIKDSYQYNNQSADHGRILRCRTNLERDINSLQRERIPGIKRQIHQIEEKIADLEASSTLGGI